MAIGYLDQIMEYVYNEAQLKQTRSGKIDLKELIKGAKNNIIIVGGTLSSLDSYKRELRDIPQKVKIELYLTDLEYIKQNKELYLLQNYKDIQQFESRYNFFLENILPFLRARENLRCYTLQRVMSTTYIGIDTDRASASSQILAEYYTLGDDYDLAFLVKPGCELYNIYRGQLTAIQTLEKTQL